MSDALTRTARRPDSTAAVMLQQLNEALSQDLSGYGALRELLNRQFDAAMRHEADAMAALSAQILAQTVQIDARRLRQRELLVALLGRHAEPTLRVLVARLPAAAAAPIASIRRAIERALAECKALNLRNAQLITEQQALMQRLLGHEEHVYAAP